MCQIAITIDVTNGVTLASATGRYRINGAGSWEPEFDIDLFNPQTPNIIDYGLYDLEVKITSDLGVDSVWEASAFTVDANCASRTAINFGVGGGSASSVEACADFPGGTTFYIPSTETFSTTDVIYDHITNVTTAPADIYSDGVTSRTWDGVSVIGFNITCISSQLINLSTGADSLDACAASLTPYYINAANTFVTATLLYTDEFLLNLAVAGTYSDGTDYRVWDGGNFATGGSEGTCTVSVELSDMGTDLFTGNAACADSSGSGLSYYVADGKTFQTATSIWSDSNLTISVDESWLSDGSYYRYWNGSAFLSGGIYEEGPCGTYSVVTGYHLTGAGSACAGTGTAARWIDSSTLQNATGIWTSNNFIPGNYDIAGYYSDGSTSRSWNGASFTGPISCIPPVTVSLGFDAVLGEFVAACAAGQTDYYIPNGETFSNASLLWNEETVPHTLADSGEYSDGIEHRFWNGTAFGGGVDGACI